LVELTAPWRVLNALSLLGRYIQLSFLPIKLSADYSYNQIELISNFFQYENLYFLYILILTLIFVLGLKNKFSLSAKHSFFSAWFFLSFVITSNIFFPIGTIFAERLAYIPSFGLCALGALFLSRESSKSISKFLLPIFFTFYGVKAFSQSLYWKDNITLHQHQITVSADSAKTQLNYALILRLKKDFSGSKKHIDEALKIYPNYPEGFLARASLRAELKSFELAKQDLITALNLRPDLIAAYVLQGKIALLENQHYAAKNYFLNALKIQASNFDAQLGLIAAHINLKEFDKAIELRNKLIKFYPEHPELLSISRKLDTITTPK